MMCSSPQVRRGHKVDAGCDGGSGGKASAIVAVESWADAGLSWVPCCILYQYDLYVQYCTYLPELSIIASINESD